MPPAGYVQVTRQLEGGCFGSLSIKPATMSRATIAAPDRSRIDEPAKKPGYETIR